MTANPFAVLLRYVEAFTFKGNTPQPDAHGKWVRRKDVLAAFAAAVPDDLVEAGKVLDDVKAAEAICHSEDCFQQAAHFKDAADLITALLARIAAREAQIKGLEQHVADLLADQECGCGYDKPTDVCLGHLPLHRKTVARAEAAETALDAERAKVAKLVEAGKRVLDAPFDTMEEHNAVTDLRAAIMEASQ